jgi:hypothetical protein
LVIVQVIGHLQGENPGALKTQIRAAQASTLVDVGRGTLSGAERCSLS